MLWQCVRIMWRRANFLCVDGIYNYALWQHAMIYYKFVLICTFFSFFCPCHIDYLPTDIHVVWEVHHTHDSLCTVQISFIAVIVLFFIKFYLCTVHNGLMLCQTTNLLNFDTVMMNTWDEYLRTELQIDAVYLGSYC